MSIDLSQFHFMRPMYLALLPVAVIYWLSFKRWSANSNWRNYIPEPMLNALQITHVGQSKWWSRGLLLAALLLIVASAGPAWIKQAVPTVQNQNALVVLLDLSPSMLAEDLKPNRLQRAKYKLIDVLRRQDDGQMALIAYAGDAHTVSPLTDDPRTIEALLPALHPDVMPSPGSNIEAAIELAQQLLVDAGVGSGKLLLITDGVANDAISTVQDRLRGNNRLSILGVGGTAAAPIPDADGGFLRAGNGEIILSAVNSTELRQLASASGGRYTRITANDSDISALLDDGYESGDTTELGLNTNTFDTWTDMGYLLVLLVLPLALLCFRKGLIYALICALPLIFIQPSDLHAASDSGFEWADLWKTPNQQAAELMENKEYERAAETFELDEWAAIANYKNGAYQQAASQLTDKNDVTSHYNRGNALALSGNLEAAIESYQQALDQQPDHVDAQHNKSVVEKLLQEQEQKQNQQDSEPQTNQQNEQRDSDQQPGESGQQPPQDQQSSESADQSSGQPSSPTGEGNEDSSRGEQPKSDSTQKASATDTENSESNQDGEKEASRDKPADNGDGVAEQQAAEDGDSQRDAENVGIDGQADKEQLADASEQWLRSIQDDPSGLLRRKFEHQARMRERQTGSTTSDAAGDTRY